MSHVATVELEMRDIPALLGVCEKLGFKVELGRTVKFFDGTKVKGTAVQLPGWNYPVVVTDTKVAFDNYQGAWGDLKDLNKLKQGYATEVTRNQAKRLGFRIQHERLMEDGTVKLTLTK